MQIAEHEQERRIQYFMSILSFKGPTYSTSQPTRLKTQAKWNDIKYSPCYKLCLWVPMHMRCLGRGFIYNSLVWYQLIGVMTFNCSGAKIKGCKGPGDKRRPTKTMWARVVAGRGAGIVHRSRVVPPVSQKSGSRTSKLEHLLTVTNF